MIQTIVTDCDDTLLNDDLTISPYTQDILRQAHQKGLRIILASGRAAASMRPFVEMLGFNDPYIAYNGAVTIDGGTHQALNEKRFTVSKARECAAFFRENHMYAHFYKGGKFYYSEEGPYSLAYAQTTNMEGVLVDDLEKAINHPVMKLLGMDSEVNIAKAYMKAKERFKDSVAITVSKPYFLEMNPQGATKGDALQWLSKQIGIDPETTMAFGDSLNDITMLKWAKYGVAMQNARDEVKAAVKYTTDHNNTQDGLARMIERYVLKEERIQ